MKTQTDNEFLDQVVNILTRRHNYAVQSDLIDGGLNTWNLKFK